MVDVSRMPAASFGYVPTPALVAPIEFTLRREDYGALGGYLDSIVPLETVLEAARLRTEGWNPANPWPMAVPEGRTRA